MGFVERLAARLVLGYEGPRPEAVDEPATATQLLDPLLEAVNPAPVHSKNLEELIPKGLCLPALITCIAPFSGEPNRAVANFIP